MKRSCVLAGTIILLAVMFASVGFAAACHVPTPPTPHEPIEYYPALEIKLNGMIWCFKTTDVDTSTGEPGSFNGMQVIKSSIKAWCWGEDAITIYLDPVAIVKTRDFVMLMFLPRNLPKAVMIGTTVAGELTSGDTFLSYDGGGFAWGGIR
jgi:hypothetical protein